MRLLKRLFVGDSIIVLKESIQFEVERARLCACTADKSSHSHVCVTRSMCCPFGLSSGVSLFVSNSHSNKIVKLFAIIFKDFI